MSSNDTIKDEEEKIKSTAIVKYSIPKPAQFMQLQCNTDLNLPPSNWLSSSAESYGLQQVLYHPKGFSSFRMAHMFPDCVGEVDIVSDAENIKNLLKLPYSKGHISMMVHRVENTLLLDDFDIYRHLLRTAETDWEWLRKFFYEHVNDKTYEEDKNLYIKNRRREALKQKSLVSKFLYHSLLVDKSDETSQNSAKKDTEDECNENINGPLLPEPSPNEEVPDSTTFDHKFNRNVVWTFEDIEMLIGTDMPIFGGGTHPCISLRLRDMTKPINVLTGIDYWLDNLMSNVPEVVMCYHLNGIVQKYELIKTEDLPQLDNSKFSPKLIRDVAQNILSFLKSNATKAGHTYWLFKGKDEDVVKLYDLTSLCSEEDVETGQNPFTIPVAMLLYRVARNMKHSTDRKQPGTIKMLLKNCLKLLPEEKYPEIVTSSRYMLADLYIPAGTNPESPLIEQKDSDESDAFFYDVDDDDDDENDKDNTTKVLALDLKQVPVTADYYKPPPPPISGSLEERCLQAIQHIFEGLKCLKYFPETSSTATNTEQKNKKEDDIPMAKPFEPIPMPYETLTPQNEVNSGGKKKNRRKKKQVVEKKNDLKSETTALLLKNNNEAQKLPTWQYGHDMNNISWKDHLKTLLYEKIVLVYAILSEHYFVQGMYGSSLRCIGLLARCQLIMNKLLYISNTLRENCLLGRAGDCCIMMVQNWTNVEEYRKQFETHTDEDLKMMDQLIIDEQENGITIGDCSIKCVFLYDIRTVEQMLMKGIECYEQALNISMTENILRRLANNLNELASYYLSRARQAKTNDAVAESCRQAEPYLVRSLEIFEQVKDDANIALIHANMGHLNRLLAHASRPEERGQLTNNEKVYYNKALLHYKKALQVLGERKHCTSIWDIVNWELSTALFNMGTILQDNPSNILSTNEAEKEVIEMLLKALQYCDLDERNPKFPLYQYRAAVIHYRIGSLYHKRVLETLNDRKNIIQLAKINYEKSAKLYFASADAINYLTVQMQRFALSEHLAESTNVVNIKIKHLQQCLDVVMEINDLIELICEKKIDTSEEILDSSDDNFKSCLSLCQLVRQRLQHILKSLIKLTTTNNKELTKIYKDCYKFALEVGDYLNFVQLVNKLHLVLNKIKERLNVKE